MSKSQRRNQPSAFPPPLLHAVHSQPSPPVLPSPPKRRRLNPTPSSSVGTSHSSSPTPDPAVELSHARLQSSLRVLSIWNSLESKYRRDIAEDDIVDLYTDTIVQDSGVLRAAPVHQYQIGYFAGVDGEDDDADVELEDTEDGAPDAPRRAPEAEEADDEDDDFEGWSNLDDQFGTPPPPPPAPPKSWSDMAATTAQDDAEDLREFLREEEARRLREGNIDEDLYNAEASEDVPEVEPDEIHQEDDESSEDEMLITGPPSRPPDTKARASEELWHEPPHTTFTPMKRTPRPSFLQLDTPPASKASTAPSDTAMSLDSPMGRVSLSTSPSFARTWDIDKDPRYGLSPTIPEKSWSASRSESPSPSPPPFRTAREPSLDFDDPPPPQSPKKRKRHSSIRQSPPRDVSPELGQSPPPNSESDEELECEEADNDDEVSESEDAQVEQEEQLVVDDDSDDDPLGRFDDIDEQYSIPRPTPLRPSRQSVKRESPELSPGHSPPPEEEEEEAEADEDGGNEEDQEDVEQAEPEHHPSPPPEIIPEIEEEEDDDDDPMALGSSSPFVYDNGPPPVFYPPGPQMPPPTGIPPDPNNVLAQVMYSLNYLVQSGYHLPPPPQHAMPPPPIGHPPHTPAAHVHNPYPYPHPPPYGYYHYPPPPHSSSPWPYHPPPNPHTPIHSSPLAGYDSTHHRGKATRQLGSTPSSLVPKRISTRGSGVASGSNPSWGREVGTVVKHSRTQPSEYTHPKLAPLLATGSGDRKGKGKGPEVQAQGSQQSSPRASGSPLSSSRSKIPVFKSSRRSTTTGEVLVGVEITTPSPASHQRSRLMKSDKGG